MALLKLRQKLLHKEHSRRNQRAKNRQGEKRRGQLKSVKRSSGCRDLHRPWGAETDARGLRGGSSGHAHYTTQAQRETCPSRDTRKDSSLWRVERQISGISLKHRLCFGGLGWGLGVCTSPQLPGDDKLPVHGPWRWGAIRKGGLTQQL